MKNMKRGGTVRLLVALILLSAEGQLFAEDHLDVSRITIEAAKDSIKALNEVQLREFCDEVLQSNRVDLVQLCFSDQGTAANILRAMRRMPDSPFRRKLILLLLRTPEKAWPDKGGIMITDMERDGAVRDVTEFVGEYLPNIKLTYDDIDSPEKRFRLADMYEKSVLRDHPLPDQVSKEKSREVAEDGRQSGPVRLPVGRNVPNTVPNATDDYLIFWLGGLLLLLSAGILYRQIRLKRHTKLG